MGHIHGDRNAIRKTLPDKRTALINKISLNSFYLFRRNLRPSNKQSSRAIFQNLGVISMSQDAFLYVPLSDAHPFRDRSCLPYQINASLIKFLKRYLLKIAPSVIACFYPG